MIRANRQLQDARTTRKCSHIALYPAKMEVVLMNLVEVLVFLGIFSSAAGHRKGLRVSLDLRHQYATTLLDLPWQFLAERVL